MSFAALILMAAVGGGPDRSLSGCHAVPVVAHRGVHSRWNTEDTTASFARAVEMGADVVEGDARLSRSGTWVLMHDPTVDRTTHAHGRVGRMSDARLATVRYDDGRTGVSTLDAALDPLTASPATQLQLEIKPAGVRTPSLRRFLEVLAAHGLQGRATITSFHAGDLARLHRLDPSWRTALITTHRPGRARSLRRYGAQVDLEARAVSASAVRALHRAGLTVQSWTVDSRRTWRRVVRSGVDGVITDRVTSSRRWCAASGG